MYITEINETPFCIQMRKKKWVVSNHIVISKVKWGLSCTIYERGFNFDIGVDSCVGTNISFKRWENYRFNCRW